MKLPNCNIRHITMKSLLLLMCNVINGVNKKAFQLNANCRFPVVRGSGVPVF